VRHLLVVYDVADDERRNKVAKALEGFGRRLQYSIFECRLSEADFERMRARLTELLVLDEDGLIIVELCSRCAERMEVLGAVRSPRPEGKGLIVV